KRCRQRKSGKGRTTGHLSPGVGAGNNLSARSSCCQRKNRRTDKENVAFEKPRSAGRRSYRGTRIARSCCPTLRGESSARRGRGQRAQCIDRIDSANK